MTIKNKRKNKYKRNVLQFGAQWIFKDQLDAMKAFEQERKQEFYKQWMYGTTD